MFGKGSSYWLKEYISAILRFSNYFCEFREEINNVFHNYEYFENHFKGKRYFSRKLDNKTYKYRKDYKKLERLNKNKRYPIIKGVIDEIYQENNSLIPFDKIRKFCDYNINQISMNNVFDNGILENRLKFVNRRGFELKKVYSCEEIISFDTETYKGVCKLICRNDNKNNDKTDKLLKPNFILNPTFEDCLDFLTYHINNPNVYRFYFNIDFDITAILKLYNKFDKLLFMQKISKGITVKYISKKYNKKLKKIIKRIYILKWIPNRMLSIRVDGRKKRTIIFADLYTFYNCGLGIAGQKYLKKSKFDMDGNKLNTDINYWNKNEEKIIKYCINDCNLTNDLAKLLIDTIVDNGLYLPKQLISPASLAKQFFRFENYIPQLMDTPIKITQIAKNCYYGGRFEVLKRGFFDKLYLYDIVSQYPTFIKNLPDMYNGSWKIYKNIKELPKNQCIGYFECLIKIPMEEILPTIPIRKHNLLIFPNGTFLGYFTWYDLDLMRDYIIFIKKAYIYEINEKNFKPFSDKIDSLMNKKKLINKKKNELAYNLVKLTMNSLYGCFIETHENYYYYPINQEFYKRYKSGILFNPIYASQITAFGRWSVIKDIPKVKRKDIVAIHTDSILTDFNCFEPIEYLKKGKNLGNWNLENKGKSLIIGTGLYQIDKKVKTRGIPLKSVNDWFKLFKKNKNKENIIFNIKHMKKIREALVQDKNIINANRMFDIEKKLSCNCDLKRTWYDNFKNFEDLLNRNISSKPNYSYQEEFSLSLNPIVVSQTENIPLELTSFILNKSPY